MSEFARLVNQFTSVMSSLGRWLRRFAELYEVYEGLVLIGALLFGTGATAVVVQNLASRSTPTVPTDQTPGTLPSDLARLAENRIQTLGLRCAVLLIPGALPRPLSDGNARAPDVTIECFNQGDAELKPVSIMYVVSRSDLPATWASVSKLMLLRDLQDILVFHTEADASLDLLHRRGDGTWPDRPETVTAGDLSLGSISLRIPLSELYGTRRRRH